MLPPDYRASFAHWLQRVDGEALQKFSALGASQTSAPQAFIDGLANSLFNEAAAKAKGAIFTPAWLAEHLVDLACQNWKRLNTGKPIALAADLSCGSGAFLSVLAAKLPKQVRIVGVDSCPEYVALARVAVSRHKNVEVHCSDTLVELRSLGQLPLEIKTTSVPIDGYDIIVGNPPYVRCQSLTPGYSATLKQLYPDSTNGNFDLVNLFMAHALDALSPGGVAALIISSKFMSSKSGAEIRKRLSRQARILEIMDFGDGQVFDGRTTYTCTMTFSKREPRGTCKVMRFGPGIKWLDRGPISSAQVAELPADRFTEAPWHLSSGVGDDVLRLMRGAQFPRLTDLFPNISQGIRTGANHVFLVPKSLAAQFEKAVIRKYVNGESVRRCQILPSSHSLIWPYQFTSVGTVAPIDEDELARLYPRVASYLRGFRAVLAARDLGPGTPWYSYSRTQNLDLSHRSKIVARELMPRAEFAADDAGTLAICSGYALIPKFPMSKSEFRMWAAVLCTPTMEFQLRHVCTQLHSGWFRILQHHLLSVRVPSFSKSEATMVTELADLLHVKGFDERVLDELDGVVARAFGLTDAQRTEVHTYVERHHCISMPGRLSNAGKNQELHTSDLSHNVLVGSATIELSRREREKYIPVELPKYYELHSERESLRKAVTFVDSKTMPIHRWYSFTQGFSPRLVVELLSELGAPTRARVYDPFVGSGTTLLACKQEGIASFGAEISPLLCWIASLKVMNWDPAPLKRATQKLEKAKVRWSDPPGQVFHQFFVQAFSPAILQQIFGWGDWIKRRRETHVRDFMLLGLVSILEATSQLRKHGSHYRFLNKADSVGLAKLNIPVISPDAKLGPLLAAQLNKMIGDIDVVRFPKPKIPAEVFNLDSRVAVPTERSADIVITSPPYLNRNMYFAQQKAELVLTGLVTDYEDYRALVRQTLRSHVEGALPPVAMSTIPEVQRIVERIELTDNNNEKIPHMICGYFDDLKETLRTLRQVLLPGAKLAFVVGNCRWGGMVVPVDHLLAMIAEQLDYRVERIIVTRLKGNSPQQMRLYGKIPMRESIVLLKYLGETL
ncbi:MAG: HsdM family class I SAM-dependent methyltransferase [bacterium]